MLKERGLIKMSLFNVQCPYCEEIIEVDTGEPICLCPLCVAMGSICQCNDCTTKENCKNDCLKNNVKKSWFKKLFRMEN